MQFLWELEADNKYLEMQKKCSPSKNIGQLNICNVFQTRASFIIAPGQISDSFRPSSNST